MNYAFISMISKKTKILSLNYIVQQDEYVSMATQDKDGLHVTLCSLTPSLQPETEITSGISIRKEFDGGIQGL